MLPICVIPVIIIVMVTLPLDCICTAFTTSARRYCYQPCLFVSSFVSSFVTLVVISQKESSASVPNVSVNFSEVKVKVQGQNCRTGNLPLVIAWLWFKTSLPNMEILLM